LREHDASLNAFANAGKSRERVYRAVLDWPAVGRNWPAAFTGTAESRFAGEIAGESGLSGGRIAALLKNALLLG